MWLIVQYPGVLHAVADEASLNELSQQYGIHRGNLRSSSAWNSHLVASAGKHATGCSCTMCSGCAPT